MSERSTFSSIPPSAATAGDGLGAPDTHARGGTPMLALRALLERSADPESAAGASTPAFVAQFLDIAAQLARAVAELHQGGMVHRALNPANIGWNGAIGPGCLIGFSDDHAVVPETDLAYISPEQTGRTGRSVDTRTDLYALGAIFHALLTGAPPFIAADPIELVHAHLARRPLPVHAHNPALPVVLSDLILKLLEKEPERRYLTADALVADLEEIAAQWARTGAVEPFALAIHDVPRELSISDQLYGRAREIAILRDAFERACAGRRELVLVTGDPGIGKSVLVSCLAQPVAASDGYFIVGKFDPLQRGEPYAGLVQVLRTLLRTLLTEPDAALAAWRQRIQAAVSSNGQLLVDMLPEIAAILGPQAPVPAQVPAPEPPESRNRVRQVLTSFLGVFARPEHPFALFLDDLQWLDAASLELIRQWLADGKTGHLLIVGAYRDTEAGQSHARVLTDALRGTGAVAANIALKPLQADHVAALVADALHQDVARCAALATLLETKTAGNPFFIRRLLRMLHDDGLIGFDAAARAWRWDLDQIRRAPVSDNVLDLMVRTIDRLPGTTQELLQAGACIGHRFDLGALAELTGRTRANIMHELWPALDDGLLLPLREALPTGPRTVPLEQDLSGLPVTLRFVHDRVQQAAYSLLASASKQALHLAIGRQRLLLAEAGGGHDIGRHPQLFDIVDHLNLGHAQMTDAGERLAVARLNQIGRAHV